VKVKLDGVRSVHALWAAEVTAMDSSSTYLFRGMGEGQMKKILIKIGDAPDFVKFLVIARWVVCKGGSPL
jgi:hypothetical protein